MSKDKALPRARKLPEARFATAEVIRTHYVIVPEAGTSLEDLLDPIYWSHVARRLRPLDILEVHAEDGSYFAELLVRNTNQLNSAKVEVLRSKEFGVAEDEEDEFSVKWKGGHAKYAVIRRRDKAVMQDGFANKEDAATWLGTNLSSLAA